MATTAAARGLVRKAGSRDRVEAQPGGATSLAATAESIVRVITRDLNKGTVERAPRLAPFVSDVDRMFADFFNRGWLRPLGWRPPALEDEAYLPDIDVIDRETEVVVRLAVPGYRKEDLQVSVSEDGTLTLSGATTTENKEEKGSYCFREIAKGAFTRTLPLPAIVDETRAIATVSDGVLELLLPKKEAAKKRTIAIS
jgi:HSP20 family protein